MVYGVIAEHGYDGLVLATLMAGVILCIAGWFRAGSLVRWVPEAVIDGFTVGIAVLIAASQVADFLGMRVEEMPADFLERVPVLWAARGTIDWAAVAIGLMTLVAIVLLRRAWPRFPGMVVAVAGASALAIWLELPVDTIEGRFGAPPDRLPVPTLPEMSLDLVLELLPSAFVIAFLAGIAGADGRRRPDGGDRRRRGGRARGAAEAARGARGGVDDAGAVAGRPRA